MNITELITIDFLKVRFKSNQMTYNQLTTLRSNKQIRINNNILIVFGSGIKDSDYKNSDAFYYNEIFLGSMITNNKHNNKDKSIVFQFENSLFYSNTWYDYYLKLVDEMKLTMLNFSRLDIAKDIVNSKLMYLINEATRNNRNKIKINTTLRQFKPTYSNINNLDQLQQVQFGNTSSSIYILVYNKSDELKKSKKKYISKWWMENELMPLTEVERIELRLTNEATKDIDINKLTEIDYLHSIFKGEVQKRFKITKEQRRGKKITVKDITPLHYFIEKQMYLNPKNIKKPSDEISEKTIKSMIKNIYILQYNTTNKEVKEAQNISIQYYINEYNLQSYYNTNKNKWL